MDRADSKISLGPSPVTMFSITPYQSKSPKLLRCAHETEDSYCDREQSVNSDLRVAHRRGLSPKAGTNSILIYHYDISIIYFPIYIIIPALVKKNRISQLGLHEKSSLQIQAFPKPVKKCFNFA
jgi:hypothetical protein